MLSTNIESELGNVLTFAWLHSFPELTDVKAGFGSNREVVLPCSTSRPGESGFSFLLTAASGRRDARDEKLFLLRKTRREELIV